MKRAGMRWVWGLVLVLLGIVLLLNSMNISNTHDILSHWWPVFLIVIGLGKVLNGEYYDGVCWAIVGAIVSVFTAGYVSYSGDIWQVIWPIIIILIGLNLLFRSMFVSFRGDENSKFNSSTAVFSGAVKKISSKDFKGTSVSAVFGGAKLDLRDAVIAKEGATIDVSAIFGGVEVLVPRKNPVKFDAVAIFGGHEDKRDMSEIDEKLPIIDIVGEAIFGGIEVKD